MGYVNKTYLSTQFKNFADKIAKVFSKIGHTHVKSDITDFPTSMPANGGNAATVGGHTVGVNVPSDAKFTDTTYTSKTAVSGGTDVSLVTTGEKAIWNAKTSNVGTVTSIKLGTSSYTPSSGIISLPAYPTTLPANGGTADKVGHTLSIGVVRGAAQKYTFDGSSDVSLDIQIPTTASEIGALPISGGTITGTILSQKTSTSLKLTENAELICDTESKGTLTIKDSQINFSGRNGSGVLTSNSLEFFSGGITATYLNNSITKKVGNDTYTLSLPSKTGTLALTSDIVNTSTIVNLIYPVGSIYMSVNNVNPSTFLGGTWEAWGGGQVPVGVNPNDSDFSTAEKTGGSKSVTPSGTVGGHTLTTNEMPSHGHSISIPASGACTTDSQGNHQHKTNATFVDNAVRLSSEHNTVMGWVSGWGYKSNANRGLNSKTDVSLSIYVPQLSMSTNGLHSHNVPNHAHSVTQYNAGGNGSHDHSFTGNAQSNVQPYITCYMWKRTA